MWVGVGVLLGLVVVASVLGFHFGPHGHFVGVVLGAVAAIWLLVMAATGQSRPLLWVLLGADVAISGGLAALAWHGLRLGTHQLPGFAGTSLVGAEGVAVTDLDPAGIVRVRGENWSATSMNGTVMAGTEIQVIDAAGVRLNVWAEVAGSIGEGPARLDGSAGRLSFEREKNEAQ